MLRQERFGAGMADQKNLDAQYAKAIMSDGKFTVNMLACNCLNARSLIPRIERLGLHRRKCQETRSPENAKRCYEKTVRYQWSDTFLRNSVYQTDETALIHFRLQADPKSTRNMPVLLWRRRLTTQSRRHRHGHPCIFIVYSPRRAD